MLQWKIHTKINEYIGQKKYKNIQRFNLEKCCKNKNTCILIKKGGETGDKPDTNVKVWSLKILS